MNATGKQHRRTIIRQGDPTRRALGSALQPRSLQLLLRCLLSPWPGSLPIVLALLSVIVGAVEAVANPAAQKKHSQYQGCA